MAEQKCTPEAVESAIKEIQAAGRKVTVSAVMAITGGSKSTVCQLLRDWQAAQPAQDTAPALEDTITPELAKALAEYRAHVLASAQSKISTAEEAKRLAEELAKSEVEAAQEERDQARAELAKAQEAKATAEATALELERRELARSGAVAALEGQIEKLKADHAVQLAAKDEAITAQATAHATELTKATERAEKAEAESARLALLVKEVEASEDLARKLADKEAELTRTTATLTTLQEAAKAAREDARLARAELKEATDGRVADLKEAAKPKAKAIEEVMPPQTPEAVKAREDSKKGGK